MRTSSDGVYLSRIRARAVSRYARGLQSENQSKTFDIWSGKIGINTLSNKATTAKVAKSISWDPNNYELVSASLEVVATNSDTLGGLLQCYMNDTDAGDLNWGIDNTGTEDGTFDVSSIIQNGSNSFYFVYSVSGVFGASGYVTSSVLTVVLQYIGAAGKQPTNPFSTGFVLTTTDYYIIIAAAAVLSLAGVGVLLLRRKPSGPYYERRYGPRRGGYEYE